MNGVHLMLDLIWTNSKSKSVLTNGKSYQVSGTCLSIRTTNSLLIIRMFLIMIRLGPRNQMQSHRVVLPSVCMKWFHGKSAVGRLITAWSKRSSGNGMDVPLDRNNIGPLNCRTVVLPVDAFRFKYRLLLIRFEMAYSDKVGTRNDAAVRPHLEVIDFDRIEWMRMGFFCAKPGIGWRIPKIVHLKLSSVGVWEYERYDMNCWPCPLRLRRSFRRVGSVWI